MKNLTKMILSICIIGTIAQAEDCSEFKSDMDKYDKAASQYLKDPDMYNAYSNLFIRSQISYMDCNHIELFNQLKARLDEIYNRKSPQQTNSSNSSNSDDYMNYGTGF